MCEEPVRQPKDSEEGGSEDSDSEPEAADAGQDGAQVSVAVPVGHQPALQPVVPAAEPRYCCKVGRLPRASVRAGGGPCCAPPATLSATWSQHYLAARRGGAGLPGDGDDTHGGPVVTGQKN